MALNGAITLPNGKTMPLLGFGTSMCGPNILETKEQFKLSLENALEAGYRHIDTAPIYRTETLIGEVLKKWINSGRIKREDLFIVTKLPPTGNRPSDVKKWIQMSLEKLQLEYLDLYLIQVPYTLPEVGESLCNFNSDGTLSLDLSTDHLAIWKAMEDQVKAGHVKAIGLSNFNIKQIRRILNNAEQPISNLQVEIHLHFQQKELVEFCKAEGIPLTAYYPLGSRGNVKRMLKASKIPDIMKNTKVIKIARKYNKSEAQIALKFLIQNGIAAIPNSTNSERIKQNINLFDFEISNGDMKILISADKGEKARICYLSFYTEVFDHPEYPFQLQKNI